MKKSLVYLICLFFWQCHERNNRIDIERNYSVVGSYSINTALENHTIKRDTLVVIIDPLGYYSVNSSPSESEGKGKLAIRNADICHYYSDGGCLRTINFVRANINEITFFGTGGVGNKSKAIFNDIINIKIQGNGLVSNYRMPFYKNGIIDEHCSFRTDSLHIDFNKYPLIKGDTIKGFLKYVALKKCQVDYSYKPIYENVSLRGYFECIVE